MLFHIKKAGANFLSTLGFRFTLGSAISSLHLYPGGPAKIKAAPKVKVKGEIATVYHAELYIPIFRPRQVFISTCKDLTVYKIQPENPAADFLGKM